MTLPHPQRGSLHYWAFVGDVTRLACRLENAVLSEGEESTSARPAAAARVNGLEGSGFRGFRVERVSGLYSWLSPGACT